PASAAPALRLDHEGRANTRSLSKQRVFVVVAIPARDDGDPIFERKPPRSAFVAHGGQDARIRPDEHDAFGVTALCEVGAFAEEAVAGMDGLAAGVSRSGD